VIAVEWSIQQIAKLTGTTSRALRHYGELGLLAPSRVGANGYRYYDATALVRLQRILLLRELGLGLATIAQVLERDTTQQQALESHLAWLRDEQHRLERQIRSVESTLDALEKGEQPMAEQMFDGFDHTVHKEEVEQRWGAKAYADGDRWWRGMSEQDRAAWQQRSSDLAAAWIVVAESGVTPDSPEAQAVAARHAEWLRSVPGTPADSGDPADLAGYLRGLGEMYVADPRFGANYATARGGAHGAEFVRDALSAYADTLR
jgi:DNA-binding transcriptional MerR regulator